MSYYIKTKEQEILSKVKNLKKYNEHIALSPVIKLNGKSYREIQILKQSPLNLIGQKPIGFIVVDEDFNPIPLSECPKKLISMMEFFSSITDVNNRYSLIHLAHNKQQFQMEKSSYINAMNTLKEIIEESDRDCIKFSEFYSEVYNRKIENANLINSLVNSFSETLKINEFLDEEMFDTLNAQYREVNVSNFKRIKFIFSNKTLLFNVYKLCNGENRKIKNKFKAKKSTNLSSLNNALRYNIELLDTYKKIIPYTISEYHEYLNSSEEKLLQERISQIRNPK